MQERQEDGVISCAHRWARFLPPWQDISLLPKFQYQRHDRPRPRQAVM